KNANVEVIMHPAYRRRGAGRALLEYAVSVARRAGRSRVMGKTLDTLPGGTARDEPGRAFAVAMGMTPVLAEVRRRLDLSTVDPAEHARRLTGAWVKAGGYSTVHWGTTTPEEIIEDIASLDSSFLEQAPLGDLALEPEKVDAERLRRIDDTRIVYGI